MKIAAKLPLTFAAAVSLTFLAGLYGLYGVQRALGSATAAADAQQALGVGLILMLVAGVIGVSLGFVMARHIAASLAHARDVVRAAAAGDLSTQVEAHGADEVTELLDSLKAMQTALGRVVTTVRRNSENAASASGQIASGNNDLSHRTEQQASALEETAASMEELSSTVKQNADNAKQANQLALGASAVAVKGGEVVGRVVDTMKGINDSSKRIADIISVIDSIAFQTNILALNAAVEAARAGEQGRGFAVVASEVRSLAQRSADAAKEIKTLINVSVERVEQGTSLVDQAGATMQEIVTAIKRVTDIMGEISSASTEQSAGVAQVGEAITQMDQATQQNAALVEQSAAAAESLKVQAAQLVQAVAVFKLGADESTQHGGRMASSAAVAVHTANPLPPAKVAPTERRGPNRVKNVTRPAFGAARAIPLAKPVVSGDTPPHPLAAKTGTGEWESF